MIRFSLSLLLIIAFSLMMNSQPPCFQLPYGIVGNFPKELVLKDFNNDGKPDIVTVNQNSNSLSFCSGNGNGTFNVAVTSTVPVNSGPISLASADFNNDGEFDIVTANENSNRISVLFGNGTGSFTINTSYTIGAQPRDVIAEDFNSDGAIDIVTSNNSSNTISLFLNAGIGTFLAPANFIVGSNPCTMICKDINHDSKKDILVSNFNPSSRVTVLLATGTGSFNPPAHYSGGNGSNTFVVGDYNEDGNEDIIVSTCGMVSSITNQLYFYAGNSNGSFSPLVTFTVNNPTSGSLPCVQELTSGDFNGDSHLDFACDDSFVKGNGNGTFASSIHYPGTNDLFSSGDVNNDGVTDFILTESFQNAFYVVLGNISSNFQSNIGFPTVLNPLCLVSADFDNDNKQDIILAGVNSITVYQNNGIGFTNVISYSTTAPCESMSCGDYNNDGNVDFAALLSMNQQIVVFFGNGTGAFSASTFSVGVYPRNIISTDLNDDGIDDLVCSNKISQTLTVLLGENSGGLISSTLNYFSYHPDALASADFNGDGKQDLVFPDDNTNSLILLTGDGTGSFLTPSIISTLSSSPFWVDTGDLNNDGKADIVVSKYNVLSVYINNGFGSFLSPVNYSGANTIYSLKISDINGDGKLDIIARKGDNLLEIRKGNGNGTFGIAIPYQVYANLNNLVVNDFNFDGINDIATTHDANDAFLVLINKSSHIANFAQNSICQVGQSVTLNGTKGADYYLWQPSGSTIDSIIVTTPGVYSLTTTNNNGCVSTSTINIGTSPQMTITSIPPSIGTCSGSTTTLNVSGASTYTWSTGDIGTICIVSPTATTIYSVSATDLNNCTGMQTVTVIADTTCYVWPGDANSDGTANNLDVLELGLHYTQAGPARSTVSNSWQSYFANNWTGTITNGKNLKHSDCNGDGTINDNDTLAIYNNYGLTHTFKPAETNTVNTQMSIVPDQPMVVKGMWGTASIYLGSATSNITNINGVAFTIDFDNTLIETNSIYIEYQNSFLDAGQNLDFRKLDFANGKIFTATTHTLNSNVSGFGKIATLHYRIKSSLTTDQVLNLGLSQANQSNASGIITSLTTGTGTLMAIGASVGLQELNGNSILVSPNPTNGSLTITSQTELQKIEVLSVTGQVILIEIPTSTSHALHLENFANGIYFVNVYQKDHIVKREKIVLNK